MLSLDTRHTSLLGSLRSDETARGYSSVARRHKRTTLHRVDFGGGRAVAIGLFEPVRRKEVRGRADGRWRANQRRQGSRCFAPGRCCPRPGQDPPGAKAPGRACREPQMTAGETGSRAATAYSCLAVRVPWRVGSGWARVLPWCRPTEAQARPPSGRDRKVESRLYAGYKEACGER